MTAPRLSALLLLVVLTGSAAWGSGGPSPLGGRGPLKRLPS